MGTLRWLQISGFSDISTATINTCFNAGNAIGMLLGGILGDLLARRFSRAARPLVNQISMFVVAPLNFLLYKALPGEAPLWVPCNLEAGWMLVSACQRRGVFPGEAPKRFVVMHADPHTSCRHRLVPAQHGRARQPKLGHRAVWCPALLHECYRSLGAGEQRRHVL